MTRRTAAIAAALAALVVFAACSAKTTGVRDITYNSAKLTAQVHCDQGDSGKFRFAVRDVQNQGSSAPWVGVAPESAGSDGWYDFTADCSGGRVPSGSGTIERTGIARGLRSSNTYQFGYQYQRSDGAVFTVGSTTNGIGGPYEDFTTAAFPGSVTPGDAGALHARVGVNIRSAYHGTGMAIVSHLEQGLTYIDVEFFRDGLWPRTDPQRALFQRWGREGKWKAMLNVCDLPKWRNERAFQCDQKWQDIAADPDLRALIESYEGPNEVNADGSRNPDGSPLTAYPTDPTTGQPCAAPCDWREAMRQWWRYSVAKQEAIPSEAGKPMVAPSFTSSQEAQNVGVLPGTDRGNAHPYPGANPNPLESVNHGRFDYCAHQAPGKPCQFGEVGYHGDTAIPANQHDGFPQEFRAYMTLRYLLEAWRNGVSRVDLFTLLGSDNPQATCPNRDTNGVLEESDWRMFDCNMNPYPIARMLHNWQTTLGSGDRTTPTPVAFRGADEATYGNAPVYLRRTVQQRADGSTLVVLWRNVTTWNRSTKQEIPVTPATVDFEVPVGTTVKVVRPVTSDVEADLPEAGKVNVGRDPVILVIRS